MCTRRRRARPAPPLALCAAVVALLCLLLPTATWLLCCCINVHPTTTTTTTTTTTATAMAHVSSTSSTTTRSVRASERNRHTAPVSAHMTARQMVCVSRHQKPSLPRSAAACLGRGTFDCLLGIPRSSHLGEPPPPMPVPGLQSRCGPNLVSSRSPPSISGALLQTHHCLPPSVVGSLAPASLFFSLSLLPASFAHTRDASRSHDATKFRPR